MKEKMKGKNGKKSERKKSENLYLKINLIQKYTEFPPSKT